MRGKGRIFVAGVAVLALAAFAGPPHTTAVVRAATPSDFNGDGYVDLAIGVPYEDLGPKGWAGSVTVLYGSSTGLGAAGSQRWTQDSPGVKGIAEGRIEGTDGDLSTEDRFGDALASGDFDADGFADLVISATGDRVEGEGSLPARNGHGAVNVLYGSSAGLTAVGDQRWSRLDWPDVPEQHSSFGTSLAAGDFDGDGYPDLAVAGAILASDALGTVGSIAILRGGPAGLSTEGGTVLVQEQVTGASDAGQAYRFGEWLAAGDLDCDGLADLAAVAISPQYAGSAVAVVYGSVTGLTPAGSQVWTPDSPGVPGEVPGDGFGTAMAISDFDADGCGDLAIGVPGDPVGILANAGAVDVLYGSELGLTGTGRQLWTLASPGVTGRAAEGDRLGARVAACDLNGDGAADLAAGAPLTDPGGAVAVLYGSPGAGLTAIGSQLWSQDSPGVPGTRERVDRFGRSLACADFGRSSPADLAVGAPHEKLGDVYFAGVVNVIYGTRSGLTGSGAQAWSQESRNVAGTSEPYDRFGQVLSP